MFNVHKTFWGLVLPDGQVCHGHEDIFAEDSREEIVQVQEQEVKMGYVYMRDAVPTELKIVPAGGL